MSTFLKYFTLPNITTFNQQTYIYLHGHTL